VPPGLGKVGVAALGALAIATGAVVVLLEPWAGVLFVLGGAVLLGWSVRRPR
jgi:hypothetical protein